MLMKVAQECRQALQCEQQRTHEERDIISRKRVRDDHKNSLGESDGLRAVDPTDERVPSQSKDSQRSEGQERK